MKTASENVGTTIAMLRKNKGLTQAELAEKLDVTQSVVARWEKNQVQPRVKAMEKIAATLEVSMDTLASGDYGKFAVRLSEVNDLELVELLGQIHQLNDRERDAVKVVLKAILHQVQISHLVKR